MRALTVCALATLLVASAAASPHYLRDFEAFKLKFNKKYASGEEEARRFKNFVVNVKKSKEQQARNPHAVFGVNQFSDLSAQEFKVYHNAQHVYAAARKQRLPTMHFSAAQRAAATGKTQDWRPKGAVTPVKNQGQCGSCWSFSTTGGIEGQWFLAGNTLTSVSEQELVSCDTIDSGCNGGLMDNAFTWLLQTQNGSIVTEASYPYVSGDGIVPACSLSGKQFGAQISSYNNVQLGDMTAFVYANGPLSIAVYAEPWQSYVSGILTNCPAEQIDHGVLIVGYDENNSPPYWIIKNSWGASWGESGYIRVEKTAGMCSIGQYQTSSVVSKGPTPPPGPTPPTPPGPTPPTPPSPSGDFVQKTCVDAWCKNCDTQRFPQGQCIKRNHASYIAKCDSNALLVKEFDSKDCSGAYREQSQPTDVCAIVFGAFDAEEFVTVSCNAGPGPSPPTTTTTTPAPAPPTPTPGTTFEQMQCTDPACSQNCQTQTFPQNTCLQLSSGGSATATCTPSALVMTVYPNSQSCTGASQSVPQPVNQCTQDQSGTYFENICPSSSMFGKGGKIGDVHNANVQWINNKIF
jgi:cysteine peptidase B